MPVDSKYANLPGIVKDQPDIFETSDLPESDQAQASTNQEQFESDAIERTKISSSEAFNKFKGKNLDSSQADFSDSISHDRRTGYGSKTEYEILGYDRTNETFQQKFDRLHYEIKELALLAHQNKEAGKALTDVDTLTTVNQVEYLQHQLNDIQLELADGQSTSGDPQAVLQKRLLDELKAFKPVEGQGTKGTQPDVKTNHVTYEMYYRPDTKFGSNARVADLEQRLERLEAVIGNPADKLSVLSGETNSSLVASVASLDARLKVLDPTEVEHMEGRLNAINQRLAQVLEKKEAVEAHERQSKVAELYSIVKKWDGIASNLPQIVRRLATLDELHKQAMQFNQDLTHLDATQQEVVQHLKSYETMLTQVGSALQGNMKIIQDDIASVQDRINKLDGK